MNQLVSFWMSCCARHNIHSSTVETWWEVLVERYNEPQRSYHTMEHLFELHAHLEKVRDRLCDVEAVGMTLFFHDVVYAPKAHDNEEQSAQLFREFVESEKYRSTFPPVLVDNIVQYIMHTKNHLNCPSSSSSDVLYFLDMDLAILGSDRERYAKYMSQIRQEYIHVSLPDYQKGRTKVLEKFLEAKYLFKTDFFREQYEEVARHNLKWEISVLRLPEMKSVSLTIGDAKEVISFENAHQKELLLRMTDDQIRHAIAFNYEWCRAYRDINNKIIAQVMCTRTNQTNCELEFRLQHDVGGKHVLIHSLVTHREYRCRGLGTSLLKEVIARFYGESSAPERVSLWCPVDKQHFFESQGFVVARTIDDARFDGPPAEGGEVLLATTAVRPIKKELPQAKHLPIVEMTLNIA